MQLVTGIDRAFFCIRRAEVDRLIRDWRPIWLVCCFGFGLVATVAPLTAWAQGTTEDYARMERAGRWGRGQVDRINLRTHWLTDRQAMWYEVDNAPQQSEYYLVTLADGQKHRLFTSADLAQWFGELASETDAPNRPEGRNLPLWFDESLQLVYLRLQGQPYVFQRESGRLRAADPAEFPEVPVEKSVELQTSGASGERVDLVFQNRLNTTVEMFWVDSAGRPRSYGKIEPGESNTMSTFQSHVWLLRSAEGRNLALVPAQYDGQKVTLTDPEGIEIRVPRSLRRQAAFYQQGNPPTEDSARPGNRRRRTPAPEPPFVSATFAGEAAAEWNERSEWTEWMRWDAWNQRADRWADTDWDATTPGPAASASDDEETPPATPTVRPVRSQRRSPDDQWEATVEDGALVLVNRREDRRQTVDVSALEGYNFNGQFFWAPDSRFLVVLRELPAQSRTVYLIESSPRDQLQPKLQEMDYLKPGDQIRQVQPCLIDVERGLEVAVDNTLFSNPWSLHDFRWSSDSQEFSFRYNQRGHQVMRVVGLRIDGSTRAIVDEVSDTFVDYTGKFFVDYIDSSGEILWASQRDGWNHLYLMDRTSGQVKQQITRGPWVVREVQQVDQEQRRIWFTASGIYPDQDPYQLHYCHVDFEGQDLVVMTAGDGDHQLQYSPDQKYLQATYSRMDLPPVTEIREVATGRLVVELERGDWSRLLETGWRPPQTFSAKGRDGKTDIYGVIYRPSNFDPQKKYPVIEYIYAGPQGAFVPKSFQPTRWEKSLAELGFIVVQIDGMGTNHRSKAFHDVCWKNLGDGGFPDRILWLQAAAAQEPAMDLTRVGIFGGSAGGQNAARAVLAFGEHYHVAVADCGCHDNRMDKIWWNEQWMGWPIDDHYADQSNVTQAGNLTGKLFLIVGELDRNVDPASTMQVVDALIRANKDFDLLVVPGGGHGIGSGAYGRRRTADFFVRHLWGTEPRQ